MIQQHTKSYGSNGKHLYEIVNSLEHKIIAKGVRQKNMGKGK